MAYTGRGEPPGYPELTYTSPCRENGVGTTLTVIPRSSQSSLPSMSYERTLFIPDVTISVRSSFSQTNGDDQSSTSSRLVRHSSSPVRLLYAAMNDSFALS